MHTANDSRARGGRSGGSEPVAPESDVFSAAEIARAAGVRPRDVSNLADAGLIRAAPGGFFAAPEAVRAVRALGGTAADRLLFRPAGGVGREPGLPAVVSGTVHALVLGTLVLATVRAAAPQARAARAAPADLRMVFLVAAGPGGGGGGGGRHETTPPPPAERRDASVLHSPVPIRKEPVRIETPPVVRHVEPPPPKPEPQVVAPIVAASNDPRDRAGIPWQAHDRPSSPAESHGPGTGGGTGTGRGSGVGEGDGAGIGPGSGAGTGGGPYRPGSGITPPAIVREVKADYTEEARRRNVQGDVELEVVVQRDGSVGAVTLQRGLGAGLDQRAIDAVRQWRFEPARRYGVPVDVAVEVAVEFKLR